MNPLAHQHPENRAEAPKHRQCIRFRTPATPVVSQCSRRTTPHSRTTPPKLSVLVRIALDASHAEIIVTGRMTTHNQQGLHPVIDRVRTLAPATTVTVDLTAAHVEAGAAQRLRQRIDRGTGGAVHVLPPGETIRTGPR